MISEEKVYQYGNTVRFQCSFQDFNGTAVNPDTVYLIFYDEKYTKLEEYTVSTTLTTGTFYYDYTTPQKEGKLYYEWKGLMGTMPSLKRNSFKLKFV